MDFDMIFDTHAHVLSADVVRYPYSTLRGDAQPRVSPVVFPVEGLWFRGGDLMQSRLHSLHCALQLKARMAGVPTPVYFRRSQ
jgi:hypothetical protein